jgi:hypothetical protein
MPNDVTYLETRGSVRAQALRKICATLGITAATLVEARTGEAPTPPGDRRATVTLCTKAMGREAARAAAQHTAPRVHPFQRPSVRARLERLLELPIRSLVIVSVVDGSGRAMYDIDPHDDDPTEPLIGGLMNAVYDLQRTARTVLEDDGDGDGAEA